jgi:N-acetylglutamate synthase-like GNAT family acetyltransferase
MSCLAWLARPARAVEAHGAVADPSAAAVAQLGMTEDAACWSVHAIHGAVPTRRDAAHLLTGDVKVRHAVESDQSAIVALVRSERLNPNDLDWRRFVVASDGVTLVGAVQLRRNSDGSHELASLVVRPQMRARGVAARMIELLIQGGSERLYAVTRPANVARFARWGFAPIDPHDAPSEVRRRRRLGLLLGGALALMRGRRPSALVVLRYAGLA